MSDVFISYSGIYDGGNVSISYDNFLLHGIK